MTFAIITLAAICFLTLWLNYDLPAFVVPEPWLWTDNGRNGL